MAQSFTDPQAVTILVCVMGVIILLNTVGLIIALEKASRKLELACRQIDQVMAKIRTYSDKAQALLHHLLRAKDHVTGMERTAQSLINNTYDSMVEANQGATQGLEQASSALQVADRRLDLALGQLKKQVTRVDQLVRFPAIQVTALVHGLAAAMREMSRSRQRQPRTHSVEEEDFI
jgi:hypothetical protein